MIGLVLAAALQPRIQRQGAKRQRRRENSKPGEVDARAPQALTRTSARKGRQNFCAFAPLRLCVKNLPHGPLADGRRKLVAIRVHNFTGFQSVEAGVPK